jgi:hypothetical protein
VLVASLTSRNVNELVDVVFSALSPQVLEDVADEGEQILL